MSYRLNILSTPKISLLLTSCSAIILILGSNASALKHTSEPVKDKSLSVASIITIHTTLEQPNNRKLIHNITGTVVNPPAPTPVINPAQPSTVGANIPTPSKTTQPVIKYKTSPDPMSTAYSTTPPVPSLKDVNIAITHSEQVPVGALITYNSTKDYKVYYGGDLQFSVPSTTIIKSMGNQYSSTFTVTIPDGQTSNQPSLPWNDSNSAAFPAATANSGPGSSWSMELSLASGITQGTYQIHFTTLRVGGGDIAWEYDGFMDLTVQ